jgi:OFA family oxalate/formate antiporter-like MFS transporter
MSNENSSKVNAAPGSGQNADAKQATEKKVMNRWVVVIGAILIQLALGAIYAWSAFTVPLQGGATAANSAVSEYAFSPMEALSIFAAGLATFAVFTILGGRIMKKIGPMKTAMIGGIVLGLGYILGGLVGANFIAKLATIGIIGGAGIGIAYVVPIATGVKWFPDKKGLVSGIAVAGFGFGSFIWILLANPPSLLGFTGLIVRENGIYTVANVDWVFMVYGLIFMALVILGALVMKNPPEGWKPAGWNPPAPAPGKTASKGLSVKEMVRTPQFYMIWTMFMFGALAGLMIIGNVKNFGQSAAEGFQNYGFTAEDAADYAIIGAAICLPILNGIGRIVWGQVSDKIGRKKSLVSMFFVQALMMLAFFYTPFNPIAFFVVAAFIGFNFGGLLAMAPAATADSFGADTVGINYGFVFTAYGVGGVAGPLLCAYVQNEGLSFTYAFIPAAVMCFIAMGIALLYKPEVVRKEECKA